MSKLSKDAKERIIISLTSDPVGKEVIKAIEDSGILTGNTSPADSLGDNGNLYMNLINGDLFKKFNDHWVLQANGVGNGVEAAFEDIEQPVGLKTPSLVTLAINDSNRTLTVDRVEDSFICFVKGKRIEITSTLEAIWPDTHGLHFFYIDENGDLITTTSFTESIITEYTFVSILYWDATVKKHIYWGDERHSIKMSPQTHVYLHRTRGTAFDRGCKLVNFVADGGGSLATHAQFSANSGVIWDEDIEISVSSQTQFPVLYRQGVTNWKRKEANSFPIIMSGEEGYVGAGGLIAYNNFDGTNWSLAQVDNNKFMLIHVFATNDIDFPFMCVLGQAMYNDKTSARAVSATEIKTISGLPFAEFCPVGSIVFQTSSSYTNTPKAQIVSVNGNSYEDHRGESLRPGSLA